MIVLITDYNQSVNSPSALRNRLLKYLIPVILISFLFNGPKFFEARVGYSNSTVLATPTNETLTNLTLSDGTMNTLLEQESIEWTPYVSNCVMRNDLVCYLVNDIFVLFLAKRGNFFLVVFLIFLILVTR